MADRQLLIGAYTDTAGEQQTDSPRGILTASYHGSHISDATLAAELTNPSWIAASTGLRHVYAVIETQTHAGVPGGAVAAFTRGWHDDQLRLLNIQPSGGVGPAHLAVDPTDRFVVVANYQDGSISVSSRERDGTVGQIVDHKQHVGSGAHPLRQSGPHPHQISFDPQHPRFLVPDLGTDQIVVYDLHHNGSLTERSDLAITANPGAGPRHVAWHPDGHHLFVINELNNTVSSYRRQGQTFTEIQTVTTLPTEFNGHSQAGAIRVRQTGDLIFASNRGHDSIAVFAFDSHLEHLTLRYHEPTRGQEPRDIALTPDDQTLVVANQRSDNIVTFAVDPPTGRLQYRSTSHAQKPTCLLFL